MSKPEISVGQTWSHNFSEENIIVTELDVHGFNCFAYNRATGKTVNTKTFVSTSSWKQAYEHDYTYLYGGVSQPQDMASDACVLGESLQPSAQLEGPPCPGCGTPGSYYFGILHGHNCTVVGCMYHQ